MPRQAPASAAQRPLFQLDVVRDRGVAVTLQATDARLVDVVDDLGRRLGAPITLAPGLVNERVRVSFSGLPLESALAALAPRAYVDYEVRAAQDPRAREIHLTSADERAPEARGSVAGMLISGHTEDIGGTPNDPITLALDGDRLSLSVRAQPLAVVLRILGETLNVPVDLDAEGAQLLNVDLRLLRVEDAVLRLSPDLRLQVRADLYRGTRTITRIALARPGA